MLFNSLQFIFLFLPFTLLIAGFLRGRLLLAFIALASFVFYAFAGQVWFIVPMFFTTALDFFIAQKIHASRSITRRRLLLGASLVLNLGLLGYFKYSKLILATAGTLSAVLSRSIEAQPHWIRFFEVVLPAGISFYTFQTISYTVDVYNGVAEPETDFAKFASFVAFFPHLVAGPLTRHNQLIPQLDRIAQTGTNPRWREGIYLFSLGLAKKTLIADRIGAYVDPLLGSGGPLGFAGGWLALLGYALQLYFDFSGYSDMAIGLGRLFGIELPQNFNSPYQAKNPTDFWNRWHITLSEWLRDYVYMPLVAATWEWRRLLDVRLHLCMVLTFFLGGLWHGANWTFAAWGVYHGLLLVFYHTNKKRWNRRPIVVQRLVCFLLVCLSFVFFRSADFHQARRWFGDLFLVHGSGLHSIHTSDLVLATWVAFGLLLANLAPNASGFSGFARLPQKASFALGLLTALSILLMSYSSKFLYFQF